MSFISGWVENDGIARSVLMILLLVTLGEFRAVVRKSHPDLMVSLAFMSGCFSYTWGYYEASRSICMALLNLEF